jgi:serine/threonine protein kinase/DNA-binding CsgD family transcriptional regulator
MIGRKLVNRYEVTKHLGEGSTATVYLARDTRLGREVALKILLPHVQDAARKRFFQEAEAAAQLNHTNIMGLFDIEQDGDTHFLVIEYVKGSPLSRYIPAETTRIVSLGTQIARALHYAHEHGVIHRDIKPANIQVTPEGQVKIMDLGLALPREAKRVTAHGMVIGTPAYLSPEQAQGLTLDRRTDIYSLGIVLFEMATGELPFNADDISALLLQQVRQPAPKPTSIKPNVPVALENIILRALEKKPDRRYQSADAMANALEAVRPVPSEAAAPTAPEARRRTSTVQFNKRTVRVLIADDHNVIRKTLIAFLEQREDFVVVGEASDGESAWHQTTALLPDVLILDLNMPRMGGLEVLPKIRQEAPSVKVLVLTGREEDWYIVQALRAGANGYLLKSGDEQELIDGIERVIQGQLVLGEGVPERMVDGMIGKRAETSTSLTETERQVLLYVAAGYDNTQIARKISIPLPSLIETLAQAIKKLNADDRYSAALTALRLGHISLDSLHEL